MYVAFNVCRNCRGKLPRKNIQEVVSQTIINPYSYFEKNDYSNNIDLKVGEPDFVPDSFKEWLFVECDGLPYSILRNLILNVWHCFGCKKCFYKYDTFKEHRCYLLGKCKLLDCSDSRSPSYRSYCWKVSFKIKLGSLSWF